ncbi:MAG: DAK2 domain-containing protein [Anaerolineales bacterium]|nr:DAK2 domain-containing protein [Anaerolineales bacterium]
MTDSVDVQTDTVDETIIIVVEEIDGRTLVQMFEGAAGWFERNVPHINNLNVFPVPDGDTGTNMMLTLQSALKELRALSEEQLHVSIVADKMARGALMGARGNSGVILSQILRGFARGLEEKRQATLSDLVAAFHHASDSGYKAVANPVEGTILTVIREAAEAAKSYANGATDRNILSFWTRIVNAAKEAELRTPEMLPVLKEAGVTDSGGHGLWVFLEGARRHLSGEKSDYTLSIDDDEVSEMMATVGHPTKGGSLDDEWGYDIQYLITARPGQPLDLEAIREHITDMGECPLVVGDETLIKVHVHCPNPGPAIEYGATQGSLSDVVVEDMDMQAQEFLVDADEESDAGATKITATSTAEATGIGIVAVAPSDALSDVFHGLGVAEMVSGGQTMNPSTQDILEAVEACGTETVIILPNNKNIILSANQVHELTDVDVRVLPTRTVPQGIAAAMSFNFSADIESNLAAMEEAVQHVQTGEVTTGVRNTTVGGVEVEEGDIIGMLNGKLVVSTKSVLETTRTLLSQIDLDEYEIVTFFHGDNLPEEDAQAIIDQLADEYDELELELMEGGQPHYHFIFSVE